MSRDRLDTLLNELLSDENEDDETDEDLDSEFGLSLESRLFESAELEAAISSCAETPQGVSDHVATTRIFGVDFDTVQQPESQMPAISQENPVEDLVTTLREPLLELDLMEESVRRLVSEGDSERKSTIVERLRDKLSKAESDWNPEGRPDADGGMIGGSVALRSYSVTEPISNCLQNEARYGTPQVICQGNLRGSNLLAAVGTSRGMLVVQLTLVSSQGNQDYELFELGDTRTLGTITCLACSPYSEKDRVLLAVGNAEGYISIWDVAAKKCVATISGHSMPICCMSFFNTKGICMLLSSDKKGAFQCHTLTSWVVRTSVSTKVLSEGNRQPLTFDLFPTLRPSTDDSSATRNDTYIFGEGMICLCHPNICSIGRISSEGRLSVYYQIPRPSDVQTDVLPVSSWAPLSKVTYASHSNPDIDGYIPYGTLAVSWGSQLSLLNIALLGDPLSPESPSLRRLPVKLDPSDYVRLAHEIPILTLASWTSSEEESLLMHLSWLSFETIAVLRKRGMLSQVLLFNKHLELIDQVELNDCPVAISLRTGSAGLMTMKNSIALQGTELTLVGGVGLKVCTLMNWDEAVSVLVKIEKYMLALHFLTAFHCHVSKKAYVPKLGLAHLGKRDVLQINQSVSAVLLLLLDAFFASSTPKDPSELLDIAELSVDLCVMTEQSNALFGDAFPRFVQSNGKEVFLEKLEQSLSANELTSGIPPEVMQALVEYCCEIGKPEKVERCVLRLDIASLDLNQVIPLCIRHHLFIALLYIFNNSLLEDYTTPALYLVNAIVFSENEDQIYSYGMNLLLYIRCCLLGDPYPPGFAVAGQDKVLLTKQKVLGFMLFTKIADLEKAAKVMLRDARKEEASTAFSDSFKTLSDPYPVLQCLLSVNAKTVIGLLSESLEDWECIEKDLLEVYTDGKVEEMENVRSVTQVSVDAFVNLLDKFEKEKDEIVSHLCQCVASGRAVVSSDTALLLLEHLSLASQSNAATEYVQKKEEKLFCGILKSVGIELDASKQSSSTFTCLEGKKALGLATNANLVSAAALLHHMFQDYVLAIKHHLLIGKISSSSPFTYFEESVSHFMEYQNVTELSKLKKAALSFMSELASLNPENAAAMVMKHFPNDQKAVIQGLHGSKQLLFKYLKSAIDAALVKVSTNMDVELSSDMSQLLTKAHCTLYVSLMCEYDAPSVLPFLQTYDYLVDVQECKTNCLEFGLQDAAAYLLEREGDVFGALHILIDKIRNAHKSLERTIVSKGIEGLSGSLPRQLSLGAILRVSDFPDARLNELPEEISSAQSALSTAVRLCRKSSLQRDKRTSADEKRRLETLQLWFSLLTVYIDALRGLPRLMKKRLKETSDSALEYIPSYSLKPVDQFKDYPRLAYLRDIYTALMDEVINAVADYVSLVEIAELVITEHANDKFGDFRSTLLGLINAYNYEQNILTSINRLLSADAYHVLTECYKKRQRALRAQGTDRRRL